MEKDFWRALFHDWQGILSTSGSIVLLSIALWFWDRPVPRWITLAVAILCFVFASRRTWMRERKARLDAETKIIQLSEKPQRTAAEQHDYDTAKKALQVVKEKGITALRHLRRQGSTKFGLGSSSAPLPPGLSFNDTLWVYNHCASEGLLTSTEKHGSGEKTFAVSPTMIKILDEVLYEDDATSAGH